jgi:hypothetical protein
MLAQKRLKELLHYDPDTGLFTRVKSMPRSKKGEVVGYTNGRGWLRVKIDGKHYKLHRLAFLYMEGAFPPDEVDHINGNKDDNRWCNLRKATRAQNNANRASGGNSVTGYRGVLPSGKRFFAQITKDGKRIHLGMYDCPKEAHKAYCRAAKDFYEEFARFD